MTPGTTAWSESIQERLRSALGATSPLLFADAVPPRLRPLLAAGWQDLLQQVAQYRPGQVGLVVASGAPLRTGFVDREDLRRRLIEPKREQAPQAHRAITMSVPGNQVQIFVIDERGIGSFRVTWLGPTQVSA